MPEPELEVDFRAILAEMNANASWEQLPRDLQLRWLTWIDNSGELPRVRMYQAASRLLENKFEPPRHSKIKSWASAFIGAIDWTNP